MRKSKFKPLRKGICSWCKEEKMVHSCSYRIVWPDGGLCCQECLSPSALHSMKKTAEKHGHRWVRDPHKQHVKRIKQNGKRVDIVTPREIPSPKPPKALPALPRRLEPVGSAPRRIASGPCRCHPADTPRHLRISIPTGLARAVGDRAASA